MSTRRPDKSLQPTPGRVGGSVRGSRPLARQTLDLWLPSRAPPREDGDSPAGAMPFLRGLSPQARISFTTLPCTSVRR